MTQTAWSRFRRGALWLFFAVVLAIPKTLGLRRRPRIWNSLRLAVGLAGAALAAAGGTGHGPRWTVATGLTLGLLALAIPPDRPRLSVDARARELGALVVVDGGLYRASDGRPLKTLLFVGPERLCVLDAALRLQCEVPVARLILLRAEPVNGAWKLLLAWNGGEAELLYRGPFAEHFARVAESTVRSQLPNALPILL